MTCRNLDGTVRDSMQEESVCLLKRTNWYLRRTKGTHLIRGSQAFDEPCPPFGSLAEEADEEWEDDYYCSNEIDDTEDFYFSNAAGSARIVLANRKFGKNGFIRSGRVFAQSTQTASDAKPKHPAELEHIKRSDGKKTNPKGKKALKREQKKKEEQNRLS